MLNRLQVQDLSYDRYVSWNISLGEHDHETYNYSDYYVNHSIDRDK